MFYLKNIHQISCLHVVEICYLFQDCDIGVSPSLPDHPSLVIVRCCIKLLVLCVCHQAYVRTTLQQRHVAAQARHASP